MTSRLDDRIRQLMQQVVDEAPAPPRVPVTRPALEPRRRLIPNWAVAVASAVAVVLLVGGVVWLFGPTGEEAVDQVTTTTTVSTTTTTAAPTTTTTAATPTTVPNAVPGEAEGVWTEYTSEHGLPGTAMSGIVVGHDNEVWAVSQGSSSSVLYRFDGDRWVEAGEPLQSRYWNWVVPVPGGGVAFGVGGTVEVFDGEEWHEPFWSGLTPSAAVGRGTDVRILGYTSPLVGEYRVGEIRFVDGVPVVTMADTYGGDGPSIISISNTVDVDSAGNAWFGRLAGAVRFDGTTAELVDFGARSECCTPLGVDANDNVWVALGTDVYQLTPDGEAIHHTPLKEADPSQAMASFVMTSDGSVWVFEQNRGVAHFDGVDWTFASIAEARNAGITMIRNFSGSGIAQGPDGSTWVVQLRDGRIDLSRFFDGAWHVVPTTGIEWGSVGANYATAGMTVDTDGSLWIPTSDGVARFTPSDG